VARSSAWICASVSTRSSCAIFASSAFSRLRMVLEVVARHTQRTPAGDIGSPRRFTASATRNWPQAGCSMAMAMRQ